MNEVTGRSAFSLHALRPVFGYSLRHGQSRTFRGDYSFRTTAATHQRKYLLLDHGQHWDFPKGHIEPGEDLIQTALRELKEETGVTDAELIPDFQHPVEYFFRNRKHKLIHKTVTFFLARTNTTTIQLSDEHVAHEFLPFLAAKERLTYATAKKILETAESFLSSNKKPSS